VSIERPSGAVRPRGRSLIGGGAKKVLDNLTVLWYTFLAPEEKGVMI
jgi:hypothetical protein